MKKTFHIAFIVLTLSLLISACGSHKKRSTTPSKNQSSKSKPLQFEHEALENNKPVKAPKKTPVNTSNNQSLYAFIDEWKGTPHKMGGNTKQGVDCSGFVIQLYNNIYQSSFKGRRAEDMFSETKAVSKEELQEGDLVFFKINGRRINHVGVYLKQGDFVHTSSSRGVMISNLNEAYYKQRFFMGGRKKDM